MGVRGRVWTYGELERQKHLSEGVKQNSAKDSLNQNSQEGTPPFSKCILLEP